MTECCPTCHQPYREARFGVRLPVLKAAIVDSIKAAGDVGISSEELFDRHYAGRSAKVSVLKCHINQINDVLEETDFFIFSDRENGQPRWVIRGRK